MTYSVTSTALANALQALATAINAFPSNSQANSAPVLDPFASNDPFDLSTRSGATAYEKVSSPLDVLWNGAVSSFPSFVVSLRIRAREAKWDSAGDTGITEVDGKNILTEYHSISDDDIKTHGPLAIMIGPYRIVKPCIPV